LSTRRDFGFDKAKAASGWFDSFMHVVFPERCLLCRAVLSSGNRRPLCTSCAKTFAPAGYICPVCEIILTGLGPCSCRAELPFLKSLFALSYYGDKWRFLLHNLKYYNRRSLARPLGRWLGLEIINSKIFRPDLIVPVPLHRRREKERGFNQSDLIANHTARAFRIRCQPLLKKTVDTVSQTTLSRRERFENIRGAFNCTVPSLQGKTVLLIDDIYSTGSTLNEAAKALHFSGAEVHGAVIAYNPSIK